MKTLTLTESQAAIVARYQHQRSIPEDAVIQEALDLLEQSERNRAILSNINQDMDNLSDADMDKIIDAALHGERKVKTTTNSLVLVPSLSQFSRA